MARHDLIRPRAGRRARKLAGREAASESLRAAIERSAELAKAGLGDARQAVRALRGERLPTLDQLAGLGEDFRRDTGAARPVNLTGPRGDIGR